MNLAVLLSGGTGLRMGLNIPKQYIRVSGKMLITYSLEVLLTHPLVDIVQIVAEDKWKEEILTDAERDGLDIEKICGFSMPGDERQLSVLQALMDMKTLENIDVYDIKNTVLIHDAVRPNLSKEQVTACYEALRNHDGVMPVLPMKDTAYLSEDGSHISGLLKREKIFTGQAPEVFNLEKYYKANLSLLADGLYHVKGSTEPAFMAGMDVVMIPGDENNYKITTKADLERFRKQKEIYMQEI